MPTHRMPSSRGYNLARCPACSLPLAGCICHLTPSLSARGQFWLMMHPKEITKPTNTARLISATLPSTRIFFWRRTDPDAALLNLLATPSYMPYVIFPQGNAPSFAQNGLWQDGKTPAFILLDGSWSQARRMFMRSPYLRGLPCLSLTPTLPSAYRLRRQVAPHHLSTVEAAIAILAQCGDLEASRLLEAYFQVFLAHCWAARHGHVPETQAAAEEALVVYKHGTGAGLRTEG